MQIFSSVKPVTRNIRGLDIEFFEQGNDEPLFFLHPARGLDGCENFLERLAEKYRVIAPSHPGFGRSEADYWMTSVEDLAYFYLDIFDALGLESLTLAGSSFGGWLAASIAIKLQNRLKALVLIGPLGIKISGREERDIADLFAMKRVDVMKTLFHDPAKGAIDMAALGEEQLGIIARHRESEGLFGWSPYMHDPKLKTRLHRIDAPTLVLAGAEDKMISPAYAKAFAAEIPSAQFATIADAGHFPMIEQPDVCAEKMLSFLGET